MAHFGDSPQGSAVVTAAFTDQLTKWSLGQLSRPEVAALKRACDGDIAATFAQFMGIDNVKVFVALHENKPGMARFRAVLEDSLRVTLPTLHDFVCANKEYCRQPDAVRPPPEGTVFNDLPIGIFAKELVQEVESWDEARLADARARYGSR